MTIDDLAWLASTESARRQSATSSATKVGRTSCPREQSKLELLTNSRAGSFLTCQKLHHYRYNLRRRPHGKSYALRFGSLFHTGLEAWWRAIQEKKYWSVRSFERFFASVEREDFDDFDMAKAEILLRGYNARWFDVDIEVIAVEQEFTAPLTNPATGRPSRLFRIGGKMDGIARIDGRVVVVEHKSSSEDISPGSDYWLRLRMDSQVSTYIAGARALGHETSACLYDVAARPLLKPKKATPEDKRKYKKDGTLYATCRDADETVADYSERVTLAIAENPDKYFQRGTVVRTESEIDGHARDMWDVAKMIHRARQEDRHVKNPRVCVRYGRKCEYFSVCSSTAQLDDDELFKTSEQNPELSKVADAA